MDEGSRRRYPFPLEFEGSIQDILKYFLEFEGSVQDMSEEDILSLWNLKGLIMLLLNTSSKFKGMVMIFPTFFCI